MQVENTVDIKNATYTSSIDALMVFPFLYQSVFNAYVLVKARIETDVYEASPSAGGLARTTELWTQRVDLGPHRFFSKDPRVNKLWLEVVGSDYIMW